jgi:hypothetical protein
LSPRSRDAQQVAQYQIQLYTWMIENVVFPLLLGADVSSSAYFYIVALSIGCYRYSQIKTAFSCGIHHLLREERKEEIWTRRGRSLW